MNVELTIVVNQKPLDMHSDITSLLIVTHGQKMLPLFFDVIKFVYQWKKKFLPLIIYVGGLHF